MVENKDVKDVGADDFKLSDSSNPFKAAKEIVMAALTENSQMYQYCDRVMQKDGDVINLANSGLKKQGKSVDDYLCDELVGLKEKYGVDKLEVALKMEEDSKRVDKSAKTKGDVVSSKKKSLR